MHRWENTLAKYRVLSVTYDHYRRSLGLPLIFVLLTLLRTRLVTKAYLPS